MIKRTIKVFISATIGVVLHPAARYPADPRAVFVLFCSVFSGLAALALNVGPVALEALLPTWGVVTWGILLPLGSLITLVGMAFQTLNGVITEQIGSVIVGVTAIFYSILAFTYLGLGALQVAGIILAWGASCLVRWVQLQMLILSVYREVQDQQNG